MAFEAPALVIEKNRLTKVIGGTFLGIIGDANHSFGAHVPARSLPSSDYTLQGGNRPIQDRDASCAIDIKMDWKASRTWLRWLIKQIQSDKIKGIFEVIGSYDGRNVRYWSDNSGWSTNGVAYQGSGHDTWTHVAIYRSDIKTDRGLLKGWTSTGYEDDDVSAKEVWTDYKIDKQDKNSGTTSAMTPASYLSYIHQYVKDIKVAQAESAAREAALMTAITALATGKGVDPAAIRAAAEEGARAALSDVSLSVHWESGE